MEIKIIVKYKNDQLKKVRKEKDLSQREVAKAAGVSLSAYQSYEQGKRDFNGARLDVILRTCLALECKMEDVLTDPETLKLLKQYQEMVDNME